MIAKCKLENPNYKNNRKKKDVGYHNLKEKNYLTHFMKYFKAVKVKGVLEGSGLHCVFCQTEFGIIGP